MKIFTLLIVSMTLAGCDTNPEDASHGDDGYIFGKADAICLDGVQYWAQSSRLAVRIDPNTLAPKKCVEGK